jgi:hypothetical protein
MTQSALAIDDPATPRPALWAGRVLSGLFGLFMAFDIVIKLVGLPVVDATMAQLGWPPGLARGIGVLELILLGLYVVPRTALLGAVLMTGLLGGAIATHVRVGDPLFSHVLFGVYLALFMWGGLFLRDPRVRAVMPLLR